MENKSIKIIAMVLIAGTIVVALLRDRIVSNQQNQMTVTGQGKVAYQPDIANINIGVQVDKVAKADEALKQLNQKINQISAAVEKLGIKKEDMKTQNYSLYPNYDYVGGISKVTGYNANQVVTVKVRDLTNNADLASKVISAASEAGANQVNGITYEYSDLNNLKQQARLAAIADARSKVSSVESAMGVKFVKLVGSYENVVDNSTAYYGGGMGGGGSGAMPVVGGGSQDLIVEVNLSYRIK